MTLPRLLGSLDKHGHTYHKRIFGCREAERAAGLQEFRSLHKEPIHTQHRWAGEELYLPSRMCHGVELLRYRWVRESEWLRREHFQISTTKACCWDTGHSRKGWRCWAEANPHDRWRVSTAPRSHLDAFPFDVFQRKKITPSVIWCLISSHT